MRELVSTMYAYNDWANARILVALALALAGRVAARPAQPGVRKHEPHQSLGRRSLEILGNPLPGR